MEHYALEPDVGEARWMFDSLDTIKADAKATDGAFSVVEFLEFEGSGPPMHVHGRFAEGFYVIEGQVTFSVGDEITDARSGSWILVPPGVAVAWTCCSPQARVLSITAPSGFEAFYREVGTRVDDRSKLPARVEPDIDNLVRVAARYDVSIVGPPLSAG